MPVAVFDAPNPTVSMSNAFFNNIATGHFTGGSNSDYIFVQTNDNNYAAASSLVYRYSSASIVSISDEVEIPQQVQLGRNYPNPFNPSTRIKYSIPKSAEVQLQVYNMLGRKVATLVDGTKPAGSYQVNFNAKNLASGVYIYRLKTGKQIMTRKMTLIK